MNSNFFKVGWFHSFLLGGLLMALFFGLDSGSLMARDGYGLAWVNETKKLIAAVEGDPSDENLVRLSEQLVMTGYHKADNPERIASINELVETLIAVPNVSSRLGKDLNARRENRDKKPTDYRFTYEPWRRTFFIYVMPHLRTPETIMVLGRFLDDERDQHPMQDGGRRFPPPENAYFALSGLVRIGIVDPPFSGESYELGLRHDPELKHAMPAFRSWFQEVRAGERSFSFVGEDKSYRLNKDGSWQIDVTKPTTKPTTKSESEGIE